MAALLATATLLHGHTLAQRSRWPATSAFVFLPNPNTARLLVAGYNELGADLAWAGTTVYAGTALVDKTDSGQLGTLIELTNRLDPYFRTPFRWGAYSLSAFAEKRPDEKQAGSWASIRVLERAIKTFPQDWELAWLLGLRYYLGVKSDDPAQQRTYTELGVTWIEKAVHMPRSRPDLRTLAVSLRTKLGQLDVARQLLYELIPLTTDPYARQQLEDKLRLLTSEIEREAVVQAADAFRREWEANMPYAPPSLYVLARDPDLGTYSREGILGATDPVFAHEDR